MKKKKQPLTNVSIRRNITALEYSLHDAHMSGIKLKKYDKEWQTANVKINFKEGFYKPKDGDCLPIPGYLFFENVALYFSNVYIMSTSGENYGKIKGRKYSLKKFIKKYPKVDMEIIDETYGYNQSKFAGWFYDGKDIKEFILELYHTGDMKYVTASDLANMNKN